MRATITNKIAASEIASETGITLHDLRERAKHKGIVATKFANINYYNVNQVAILTRSKLVRSKSDALLCELCEKYPTLSENELSLITGQKVWKPQFFIFQSKMNKL